MKFIQRFTFYLIGICCIQACNEKANTVKENLGPADNYSCPIVYNGDTINRYYKDLKQGHFVLFDKDMERASTKTENATQVVYTEVNKQNSLTSLGRPLEEGDYKDDKKQGAWTYYNTDGSIKTTIEYKNGVAVK